MECRPTSSFQHQQFYDQYSESEEDDEPIYHYVQDTSCEPSSSSSYIRQWAASIPYGRAPKPASSHPRRDKSPEEFHHHSRPKLLTSISRRPISTTSSSYHHANPAKSPSTETTTSTDYSSIATPPPPHSLMKNYSHHHHSHHRKSSPPSDVDPTDDAPHNVWWIPQSTSQPSRSSYSATPISISNKKSPHAYDNTGYHVQPRRMRH
ncbi:hypothetical protein PQX77_009862 [Marasmius sp. AFHP31]|nr:hypothetical protein PQX77_009862 [Marasmius sp. AFHP31]